MRMKSILAAFLCVFCFTEAFGQTDALDKELAVLTETLASQIKTAGAKKVTVIDFTDLQGASSELGKYIAEQLTLDLVSSKRDFSVLDRANRKSILAEHKLTTEGLIDPKTAKEFGKFAGVDALILGTIVPMTGNVQVTARVITTETSEVVGAGKASFPKSKDVQELLGRGLSTSGAESDAGDNSNLSSREFNAPSTVQKFGNFNVELLSFRILPTGNAFAAMQLVNTSKQTIAIAANSFHDDVFGKTLVSAKVLDENGLLVRGSKIEGLNVFPAFYNYSPPTGLGAILGGAVQNWEIYMTEVKPDEAAHFTVEFAPQKESDHQQKKVKLGNVFNIQVELITMLKKADDEKPTPKLDNVYLDKIVPTKRVNSDQTK
jgi:TolB-like protein